MSDIFRDERKRETERRWKYERERENKASRSDKKGITGKLERGREEKLRQWAGHGGETS